MKRFSKILLLVLALVAMMTAFAVVSFASEEAELGKPVVLTSKQIYSDPAKDGTFESKEVGATIQNSGSKYGKWTITEADNGNKYVVAEYEDATGPNYDNWDIMTTTSRSTYNIKLYPTFAFDFDIKSNTASYGYSSIRPDLYKGGSRMYQMSSTTLNTISLPKTTNEWHHVTLIVQYEGGGIFRHYYYVNGTQTLKKTDDYSNNDAWKAILGEDKEPTVDNILVDYVSLYPARYSEKVGYDNFKFTYYPAGWTPDAVASYHYNDSYEMPYGETVAKIGTKVYDDANKAVAAAGAADTVNLVANIKGEIIIDKNVIIDANIYDANGAATGSLYTYSFKSSKGFVPTEISSGIYSYAKSANAIDIIWDEACSEGCDCFALYGGHQLTATTVALVGDTPKYFGETPEYDMASDFTQKKFLGWSYENDGTVDTLVPLTEADLASGEPIKLYPVYTTDIFTIKVTLSTGIDRYFTEAEVQAAFNATDAGATFTLIRDTSVHDQITIPNRTITIDLNGYSFSRKADVITKYNALPDGNGGYEKGSAIGTESAGAASYLFYFGGYNSTNVFTITSSRPGAVMASIKVTADQWIYDGEVVKTENAKATAAGTLLNFYPFSGTLNVLGENVTFYASTFVYAEHGGNGSEKVNINGGTYVVVTDPAEGFLSFRNGEKVNVENAKFYCNGYLLFKNGGSNRNKSTAVTFTDCEIYNAKFYSIWENDVYTFNNCLISASISGGCRATLIFGENTMVTSGLLTDSKDYTKGSAASGLEMRSISKKVYYNAITLDNIVIDNDLYPTSEQTRKDAYSVFAYASVSPSTATATVTWKDQNGNVVAITDEIKGLLAVAPKLEWGDSYRGVMNAIWTDSLGNVSDLIIGDEDSYEFTAILPSEEDAIFESYLTGAMLNMTYYAHFGYNIYIPKIEGVTVTSIGGKAPSGSVLIYGQEYYARNAGYPNSTAALGNESITIEYTAGGQSYSVALKFNALLYAELAMNDPNSTEVEKEAITNLVRYIEESYKYVGKLDAENAAKIASFYEKYGAPEEYVTSYPEKEVHNVNEAAIAGIVESLSFSVYGSRVSFNIVLTDEAVTAGYKVRFAGGIAWSNASTKDNKHFYSDNTPLALYLMQDKYTVEIWDSENKTVVRDLNGDGTAETAATFNYSIATYLTEMENKNVNVDVAKALYAFGKSVIKVRAQIY